METKKKKIEKISETKRWFFEKIHKTDEPLAWLIKEKREKAQFNKIRNEKGREIITDYCRQLYDNKMDNLEEIDSLP